MTGKLPEDQIDHINGDPTDNRWENLRDVTNKENQMNRKLGSNNTSGFVGVYWDNSHDRWRSQIWHNSKKVNIGSFKNKQDAIEARKQANIKYGYHENHGKR